MLDGLVLPAHPFEPEAPEISREKPLLVGWNEELRSRLEKDFGDQSGLIFKTYRNM